MKRNVQIITETFSLQKTLECGQCFRWNRVKNEENSYIGIIEDRVVKICQNENCLNVYSSNMENIEQIVCNYFDLNENYVKFENDLKKYDEYMNKAIDYSSGIHILKQPLFETIISFIISANNNIPRIKNSVEKISKLYGKKVMFEESEYYLFPTIDELEKTSMDELLSCGVGFRARYILHNVEKLNIEYLEMLQQKETSNACDELMKLQGIGPKVADCVLLFALHRLEVFPVDTWIKRIMEKIYFKQFTRNDIIQKEAKEKFGNISGLAQQHLFINVRDGMM